MTAVSILIRRNVKLFFKDKGMFFTALVTPIILLVLYATFLGNVFRDSLVGNLPEGIKLSDSLVDGLVGGQLVSSILAVSCITVAFSSNFLMVQDKVTGCIKDLRMAPVKPSRLAVSYYVATLIATLLVCLTAAAICLIYVWAVGWYMSFSDILLLLVDVVVLVLFGTALSSVVNFFLSSQGQISAVSAIVSAGYGFICGAYMPISSFNEGLQKVLSFLPGTYGTSLVRNHAMGGALAEMEQQGLPKEVVTTFRELFDCNLFFFDEPVSIPAMYLVLGGAALILMLVYILLNTVKRKPR